MLTQMAQLEIEVDNPALLFALFEASRVSTGMTRELPGGGTLTYATRLPYIEKRGVPMAAAPTITFIVSFGASVAASVLGCWLYEKLTSKPTRKITIDRVQIEITPEALARIITERIGSEE